MRRYMLGWVVARWVGRAAAPLLQYGCLVNAAELAVLVAYPLESPALPGMHVGASRHLPPVAKLPINGHVLGQANFPGSNRPVAIDVAESVKHLHIMGPTGAGKSTLLLNLITQDMQSGRGIAVFDPKGGLISDVLARVPSNRAKDVVLVDPSDPDRAIGLNLLENRSLPHEVIADQVTGVFKKIFAGSWGVRTDDIMRSSLLTLLHHQGTTLCDIPILLQDPYFRSQMVGGIDDPVGLSGFWSWYESLGPGGQMDATGPIANKLRTILLRPSVRDIFGQGKSTVTMRDVLATGKILLVSQPKGQLGDDTSALLGSLLLLNLWQAVQGRKNGAPFFAYVDEFQDYLNIPSGISEILVQARAFQFGLVLAHQHLGQLNKEVLDGVLANARSKVVFQTTAADAKVLASEFGPYVIPGDLQHLEPHEAIAMVSTAAKNVPPVSIGTLPPPPICSDEEVVKRTSLGRYGRSRTTIELELRQRLLGEEMGGGDVGGRKR